MKKQLIIAGACLSAMLASTTQSFAQGGAGDLFKGGATEANILMNGYFGPVLKAFGSGLNAGWYNTAKPHGTGGFDVTGGASLTFAPSADEMYSIAGLTTLKPMNGATTAPSLFGSKEEANLPYLNIIVANPAYKYAQDNGVADPTAQLGISKDTSLASFRLPAGMGTNMFPVPFAQFAIGIYKNTEVMIRFLPTITASDFKVGMYGFGVKHDIKQWIPVIKEQKIWDLSAMFGYTRFDAKLALEEVEAGAAYGSTTGNTINVNAKPDNGSIEMTSSAWNIQVITSAKLAIFTPYLGLGYQHSSTDFKVKGQFPYTQYRAIDPNDPTSIGKKEVLLTPKDAVSLNGTSSGFRATMGARIKLFVFTIHGDYTFAEYNMATLGVGVNLQSIVPFKL